MRLLVVVVLAGWLPAQADVLVLKNGDRITGEISHVWDDEITIEPEYSDEFNVDLPAVLHIESDREFEVELQDRRRATARLRGADEDGRQLIEFDGELIAVGLDELFEVEEVEDAFDWESHIDAATNITTGNTDTRNTRIRGDTTLKLGDHRHLANVTFARESVDGIATKKQDLYRYDYNWLFRDPWFFAGQLSFERDPIRDLQNRTIVAAGIGRDIFNRPRRLLSIQLTTGYQTEKIGLESEDSAVVVWGLRFRQDFIGDDLQFLHDHSITHNVSGRKNTVYKTSTGLRYEITDLLYANATVDYDYESNPADFAGKEDVTYVLGFGMEF